MNKFFFILFVLIFSIFLFSPYMNPQELETSVFFDFKFHFMGFLLGVSLVISAIKMNFFGLNQFSKLNSLVDYFEKAFFIIFIPAILSIPICLSMNQNLDFSEEKIILATAESFEYVSDKKLKTRKCSLEVKGEDFESKVYYRPEVMKCSEDIVGSEVRLSLKSGLLSKQWLTSISLNN